MIEDDEKDVELTLEALERHSLANHVDVVHDGEEGLDYLFRRGNYKTRANGHPVVVLLDLKMPKINGLEVLQQIKSDAQLKVIPVVVFAKSRENPDIAECYKLGVNAYVVKPVDFQEFVDAVNGLSLFWAIVNEAPPGS